MEELLNKLIEKGWKPRGEGVYKTKKKVHNLIRYIEMPREIWFYVLYDWLYNQMPIQRRYILRQLVSKESWLWQFVCENKLVKKKRQWSNRWWWEPEKWFDYKDDEYRLIESALLDEDKLEQFLLDNIKIDD